MITQAFLDAYRRQNPLKFEQKFGGKTLEEINGQAKPEPVKEGLTVEVTQKEDIELGFKQPPEFTGEIIKPKRGRKKVAHEPGE